MCFIIIRAAIGFCCKTTKQHIDNTTQFNLKYDAVFIIKNIFTTLVRLYTSHVFMTCNVGD